MTIFAESDAGGRDHEEWDIEQVLLRYGLTGSQRRTGGWVAVHCPFHPDRNRSAGYSTAHNGFRCMACGAKGNPISLVMQQNSCSMAEAVRWLDEGGSSAPQPRQRDGDWWRDL